MKKFWALLLAALLVVSILPVSALATDVPEPTPAFEQGTLTINVAFNGLPEDKIPESVNGGLKRTARTFRTSSSRQRKSGQRALRSTLASMSCTRMLTAPMSAGIITFIIR